MKHKRYAEPLSTTETLKDWKTSLFKDLFSVPSSIDSSVAAKVWKTDRAIREVCDSDMNTHIHTHKQACTLQ